MMANVLMDDLFDISSGEIYDDIDSVIELSDEPVELIRNLFL